MKNSTPGDARGATVRRFPPKRTNKRRSQTPKIGTAKKGGNGQFNWGNLEDDLAVNYDPNDPNNLNDVEDLSRERTSSECSTSE
eukprot:m.19020 g.19020  ORF g.19020 m.19020 type:complete len:84 (-) comp12311_c0_seq1:92-343(-)